jgi:hypothetical protein
VHGGNELKGLDYGFQALFNGGLWRWVVCTHRVGVSLSSSVEDRARSAGGVALCRGQGSPI